MVLGYRNGKLFPGVINKADYYTGFMSLCWERGKRIKLPKYTGYDVQSPVQSISVKMFIEKQKLLDA